MRKEQFAVNQYELYLHGGWTPPAGNQYLDVLNPSNGELLARVPRAQATDAEQAVESAREGFEQWRELGGLRRSQVLAEVARILRSRVEDLAGKECDDCGCGLDFARYTVTEVAARRLEFFAGLADKIQGSTIPMPGNHFDYTLREPFGVTLHIAPWNGPLWTTSRSIVPAFAAGNSVVLKPAEQALISMLELAEICTQAGMPEGTFNVVPGLGHEVGSALVQHPDVDLVSFTGSVETGKKVMSQAAEGIKPVILELGGKSPNIVFQDAGLEEAAAGVTMGIFSGAGQICVAGSRLLVHESVRPQLLELVLERIKTLRVGPARTSPEMGPLITESHLERVLEYVQIGSREGARLVTGGHRLEREDLKRGYYMAPTVFDDVDNRMRIAQEEIFGPVLCVIPFGSEEEAIALANDSQFGLASAVWTQNLGRAHRVAQAMQAGSVYVNRYFSVGVEAPAGGCKMSGFGRLDGVEGLRQYTQVKNVTVNLDE